MLRIPRRAVQLAIRAYQKTLSPDHGPIARFKKYPTCKFYPTCSEYGYVAVGRFGILRGGWLAVKRVLRCHPWSGGGVDRVPEAS